MSDISVETTRIRVIPTDDPQSVVFTFLVDGIFELRNESLNLQLIPTPATLQTIPIGEGVFFKHVIRLTIVDSDSKYIFFSQSQCLYLAPVINLFTTGRRGDNNIALIAGVVVGVLLVVIAGMAVLLVTIAICVYHYYSKTSKKKNDQ